MKAKPILALLLFAVTVNTAFGKEFFVESGGSDTYPGTMARPFATIHRAQQAARDVAGKQPVTVNLRGGTYYLGRPVVFTPEDSGTTDRPVVFKAYGKEKVKISGGHPLPLQWEKHRGGIKKARIDKAMIGGLVFDQLFVNGERQHMARFPNYDPDAHVFDGVTSFGELCRRAKDYQKPQTGFMHAIHANRWGSMHYRIAGFERDKGTLQLEGGWQQNRASGFRKYQAMVENIFEELDAPGEWYLDRDQAVLYFYPQPGVDMQTATVETAGLEELFLFEGSSERPVKHINLEGIEFVHAARTFLDKYEPLLRGDWAICRLAAVRMSGVEDCCVRDCFFNQLGGNGVFFDGYNRRCEVTGSRFHKLGESAVCVVGSYDSVRSGPIGYGNDWPQDDFDPTPGPKGNDYPKDCRVHDCLIYNIGRVGKQTAGVFISMSEGVTVSHCTIFSVPRSGITVNDGCWGGHVIEFNDVFNTVIETGDHGPFNSWGRDRYWKTPHHGVKPYHDPDDSTGQKLARKRALLDNYKTTIIRNNRFWHGAGHSWGIDLDDGSTNYYIYNNLTLGCGLKLREGFFRRVENNVFLDSINVHVCFDNKADIFRNNIVVVSEGHPAYQGIRAKPLDAEVWDYNLYWSTGSDPVKFVPGSVDPRLRDIQQMSLQQWQQAGLDEHSIEADPIFVDPRGLNYEVKPESPALRLGFKNFPMDRFGVIKPEFKKLAEEGHQTCNTYLHPEIPESQTNAAKQASTKMSDVRPARVYELLGAKVKNITTEAQMSAVGIGRIAGVLFLDVPPASDAAKAGFREGDCVLQIGRSRIDRYRDIIAAFEKNRGKVVDILVEGNPPARRVRVTVPENFEQPR
jgi:hypothetical protein